MGTIWPFWHKNSGTCPIVLLFFSPSFFQDGHIHTNTHTHTQKISEIQSSDYLIRRGAISLSGNPQSTNRLLPGSSSNTIFLRLGLGIQVVFLRIVMKSNQQISQKRSCHHYYQQTQQLRVNVITANSLKNQMHDILHPIQFFFSHRLKGKA